MSPADELTRAAIERLLNRCVNERDVRIALRDLRNRCPELLTQVCVKWLAHHEVNEREEVLRGWLILRGTYVPCLFDPAHLSDEEALTAAGRLWCHDPNLGSRLYSFYRDNNPDRTVLIRLLTLVDRLEQVDRVFPLLRELSNHPNEHVRAKGAAIFCKCRPNRANIDRQLHSDVPRVRAGAIEALWNVRADFVMSVFAEFVQDPHPRVAANAVLGLYYGGFQEIVELLTQMLATAKPNLQLSLAWAMGRMPGADVRNLLKSLVLIGDPRVVATAEASLANLPEVPEPRVEPAEIHPEPVATRPVRMPADLTFGPVPSFTMID